MIYDSHSRMDRDHPSERNVILLKLIKVKTTHIACFDMFGTTSRTKYMYTFISRS